MNKEVAARSVLLIAVLGVIIVSAALASCSMPTPIPATPTPTKTVRPTATPAPTTPAPTPTPRPTSTPAPSPTPRPTATPEDPYTRATDINPLTGLQVSDPLTLTRRPLLVVVNNSPIARPQYGLADAELVYEYIMEGRSVTRFTAVFWANESVRIGPVRSARLVNFYLTPQYGGGLVASGAGNDVRWQLKNKMAAPYFDIDLDDPSNNVYSWSIGSNWETRMQTSTERLRKWLAKIKKEQAETPVRGFVFAQQAPKGSSGKAVSINYPAVVAWSYDAASGRYVRAMGGAPHVDAASNQPLTAANVVVQTVAHEKTNYVEDTRGATSVRIITVGEGPVTVLRDSVAITGTWKAGDAETPELLDGDGNIIPLKPGNTWFELVATTDKITVE